MKVKELSAELGVHGDVTLGGLDTLKDHDPQLVSSSLSMPEEDAQAYVLLAKELGIDHVKVIGLRDLSPQLFGPVWFIRTVGRSRPKKLPTNKPWPPDSTYSTSGQPWDYNLAVVRKLLTELPGKEALEAAWRLSGTVGLIQLIEAHQ